MRKRQMMKMMTNKNIDTATGQYIIKKDNIELRLKKMLPKYLNLFNPLAS